MSHGFMDTHSKVSAANVVGDSEFSEIDSPVPNGVIERVCMFNMVVAPIAVRTKIGSIFLPAKVVDDSKWYHGLGQVKFVGEACYTGRRFEDMGLTPDKAPKVGDLVYYNPRDSITIVYEETGSSPTTAAAAVGDSNGRRYRAPTGVGLGGRRGTTTEASPDVRRRRPRWPRARRTRRSRSHLGGRARVR